MSGTSYGKLLRLYFQSFNYFPQVVEEVRPCQFLLNQTASSSVIINHLLVATLLKLSH